MHRTAGIGRELVSRVDQRVLRWFGHVDRMDEYCVARSIEEDEDGRSKSRAGMG